MSMFRKLALVPLFVLTLALGVAPLVGAQTDECVPSTSRTCPQNTTSISLENPFKAACGTSGDCNLVNFLQSILDNIIMPIAGVIIVLALIYTGFKFVMAQGNESELKKAKEMFKLTIIGAILLLGATAISDVVKGTIDQFSTTNTTIK